MEKRQVPALRGPRDLPELEVLGKPAAVAGKAQRPQAAALGGTQPAHS